MSINRFVSKCLGLLTGREKIMHNNSYREPARHKSLLSKNLLRKTRKKQASFSDSVHRVVADQYDGELNLSPHAKFITDRIAREIVMLASSKYLCKTLNLSGCTQLTPIGAREIAHLLGPSLETLIISNTAMPESIFKVLATGIERIHTLDLSMNPLLKACGIRDFTPCCSDTLTNLNLSNCAEIGDDAMCWLAGTIGAKGSLTQCKRLRTLNLAYNSKVGYRGLAALAQGCRQLEFLNLQCVPDVTDAGICKLVEGCRKLKVIHLSQCANVGNAALRALARYCSELRSMNLAGCVRITQDGVQAIAKHCQLLESLNIEGCKLVSELALRDLAQNCKALKLLNVNGCQQITENGIKTLAENLPFVELAVNFRGLQPHRDAMPIKLKIQAKTIRNSAAIRIQSWYRGFIGRRAAQKHRENVHLTPAVLIIQRAYRRYTRERGMRKVFAALDEYYCRIIKIQALARGFLVRWRIYQASVSLFHSQPWKVAAIRIQAVFKGFLARKQNTIVAYALQAFHHERHKELLNASATRLQNAYRRRFARSRFDVVMQVARMRHQELVASAIKIQHLFRTRAARHTTWQLKEAMRIQREQHHQLIAHTIKAQQHWRGHCTRKRLVEAKRSMLAKEERKRKAATAINAGVRGYFGRRYAGQVRSEYNRRNKAVFCIQKNWRMSKLKAEDVLYLDKMVASMKAQIAFENDEAERQREEILLQHRRAAECDSASDDEADDDWKEYYDDDGQTFWYSASLERRSNERPNENAHEKALVGMKCKIEWPLEAKWYPGTISRFNAKRGKHRIDYEDGDHEWMILSEEFDRIQLFSGSCWCMYSTYIPSRKALKAALFLNVPFQFYSFEYFGWRPGTIHTFDEDSGLFHVEFHDSTDEWLDLFHSDQLVQVQDSRSLEWYSMAEYFFGRAVSQPSTMLRGAEEHYTRPTTVEEYLEYDATLRQVESVPIVDWNQDVEEEEEEYYYEEEVYEYHDDQVYLDEESVQQD